MRHWSVAVLVVAAGVFAAAAAMMGVYSFPRSSAGVGPTNPMELRDQKGTTDVSKLPDEEFEDRSVVFSIATKH